MARKIYKNFDLLIEQVSEGYTVRVFDSPGGQAKARFTLPFEDHELKNFFVQIGNPRSIEHQETHFRDQSEIETVKEFGSRLFKTIFKDEVWDCLSKSLHEINRQEEVGLRIRLRLVDAPKLADVPWEYLYIPTLKRFLALSVDTPIVRYLRLPEGIKPLYVKLPLKVLVMISNARDYPLLDVNMEWNKLKESLGDLEQKGLVKLELLKSATLSALQRQLLKDKYHVFHFIGHGGFDNQAQDGVLILEDEDGNGRKVNGQKLGTILHDENTLRLVVLNACEGARTSRTDPFAGTAQSLVQQGIPAVIAMQFEITDKAAITLSHSFYQSVAEGYPVDYSLAEARKAINSEEDFNSVEWGTPVLYMRSSDGHIFNIDPLEILKDEARSAMQKKDWKTAIDKWQAVLNIDKNFVEAKKGLNRAKWMKYRLKLGISISALILVIAGIIIIPKIIQSNSINLRIDSISIPSTVTQGDTVQVTASIHNSGNADAEDIIVRWWPNVADTTVYIDSIPEIDSKLTDSIGFTHPGYPHPGEFISRLTVNLGGDERDYLSIDSTMMIVVKDTTDFILITIDSAYIAELSVRVVQPVPSDEVSEGDPLSIVAIIFNSGEIDAESVSVRIDIDGSTVKDTTLAAVPADSSVQLSWDVNTTDISIGRHDLTINVRDRDGEEDRVTIPISIVPVPQQELSIRVVQPAPLDQVSEGDTLSIVAKISNLGDIAAESVSVRIYIDESTVKDTTLAAVPADSSVQLPWEINTTDISIGRHDLTINVRDRDGEEDSVTLTIIIIPEPQPELSVRDVSVIGYSTNGRDRVTMAITVENSNGVAVDGVKVYLEPNTDAGESNYGLIGFNHDEDTANVEVTEICAINDDSIHARISIVIDNETTTSVEATWNPEDAWQALSDGKVYHVIYD